MKTSNKLPWHLLPQLVKTALLSHRAWLVGSGADWFIAGGKGHMPRDFDLLVPPGEWQLLCRTARGVATSLRFTMFGGLKVSTADAPDIDIWPQHLEDYCTETANFVRSTKREAVRAVRMSPFAIVEIR